MPGDASRTSVYDKVTKYQIKAECREPLHVGSGDQGRGEVMIHPGQERPFLPATGIAGAFRDYFSGDKELQNKLFGSAARELEEQGNGSMLRFTDGYFEEAGVYTELRPRIRINQETGTSQSAVTKGGGTASGQKFEMELVAAGSVFEFEVYLYSKEETEKRQERSGEDFLNEKSADESGQQEGEDFSDGNSADVSGRQKEADGNGSLEKEFERALGALHAGNIQLGGQKSGGCGYVSLLSVKKTEYQMKDPQDRKLWIEEKKEPEDITGTIQKESSGEDQRIHFVLTGQTTGTVLVKAIGVKDYGENAPDSVNIRNHQKKYIIPATAMKGVLRSQMEKIAIYRNMDESVISELFGMSADEDSQGVRGTLRFYDCEIGNTKKNDEVRPQTRIHMDKFTGGVMYGHLFNEKPAFGAVKICVDVENGQSARGLGLLLLAMRDLGLGILPVGSGNSIGRGYISGENLKISRGEKSLAEIDLAGGKIRSGADVIREYLRV